MIPEITDGITDNELESSIHSLQPGTIIKITGQLERALSRLQETKPVGVTYTSILPGTALYSQYGANHVLKS